MGKEVITKSLPKKIVSLVNLSKKKQNKQQDEYETDEELEKEYVTYKYSLTDEEEEFYLDEQEERRREEDHDY
jgi:hypothetical protein